MKIAGSILKKLKDKLSRFLLWPRQDRLKKSILAKHGKVVNCTFEIDDSVVLVIGSKVLIQNCTIKGSAGSIKLGDSVILGADRETANMCLSINEGSLIIGSHSRVRADINIRFDGVLEIGSYTAINERGEIRCDNLVQIGDFCMISYGVQIFDTNTHCILPPRLRRKMTIADYPLIGMEYTVPRTAPVKIGSDVWIGVQAMILKGVVIGDGCIVGARALVAKSGSYPVASIIASPAASIVAHVEYDSLPNR
jgi:acetyltransferase-like isoleucine patch superfamily enzyme